MGAPLKNPPVYLTVAQVKFNPILKLESFLVPIQEAFRNNRFADYSEHPNIVWQLNPGNPQGVPTTTVTKRFAFGNAAKTHKFLLDGTSLTFQSTDYGMFESFTKLFLDGVALLHEIIRLDFVEQVGARYLDRVMPLPGESLSLYLTPGVRGLSANWPEAAIRHSFHESAAEIDGARIVSRVVVQNGGLTFPPDLIPLGLTIADRFQQCNGWNAMLDNDGSVARREDYSREMLLQHLTTAHGLIRTSFRSSVTEHAFKMWDK
jgi:uncharacterized protein (TIGR04255 family)